MCVCETEWPLWDMLLRKEKRKKKKKLVVSGNLTLADCCSCVPEPHSCWSERGRDGGRDEGEVEEEGRGGVGGDGRGVLSN